MSTLIKTIKGRIENVQSSADTTLSTVYSETRLSIVRFYGGNKKGSMLQLTTQNSKGYIQLDRKQVRKLIKVLSKAFDSNKHPNE